MTYRLELSEEAVPDALRAVAAEQLADAVRNLREERVTDPVTAVHEARKDLKKTRSVLRLARTGMPPRPRRETNDALREIANHLSDVRDADVMAETVTKLHERFVGQAPARAFSTIRRRFIRQAEASRTAADDAISEDVVAALQAQLADVKHWPLDDLDPDALAQGVAIAYARGRDEYRACRKDPSIEAFHEWRKRVKDLWYHAKLLEESWPPVWRAIGDEAHHLSDLLGDDHDLGVLAERIAAQQWPVSVDGPRFVELCHRRREELQAEAFALGHRLYADKPAAFARRTRTYLRA
jgi:CHAD domain-containing protein